MGKIADENEVLEMYTAIMRHDISDYVRDGNENINSQIKPSDMMKAGEAILKRLDAAESTRGDTGTQFGVVIMPEAK
ncbi:MAG: hypothetical protein Q4G33_09375 [bacterium]|nr:hypothetical protein [bacterium]